MTKAEAFDLGYRHGYYESDYREPYGAIERTFAGTEECTRMGRVDRSYADGYSAGKKARRKEDRK